MRFPFFARCQIYLLNDKDVEMHCSRLKTVATHFVADEPNGENGKRTDARSK